jgi:hypothetical protein
MPGVVGAFIGREESEGRQNEVADLVEGARPCGPQERFQFGEGELDPIEVRTVGREEPHVWPTRPIAIRTSGCLCAARLSSTTTSPGCSVGTSTGSTYARKLGLSIGPSKTAGR